MAANAYVRTTEERETEIAMMSDPMRWPLLYLPVKRMIEAHTWPEAGLMMGDGPRVYLSNIFDPRLKEPNPQIEFIDYADFAAVCDDGWVVD